MELSIIIPHKDSATLLERLLKSIPGDIDREVIVVDDNSSEEELAKVESLSETYDFQLYHNPGFRAGGARNEGMKHSGGEWVLFADADDFFTDEISPFFKKYKESDADIVYFKSTSCISSTGEPAERHLHIEQMFEKYAATGDEGYLRYKILGPVGKLFRKSILEGITFEERIAGNDMWFSACSALKAKKIIADNTVGYCITVSHGSITTTLSRDRFEARMQASIRVNKLLRKHKLNRYQMSLLYFMGKSHQFGFKYMCHAVGTCLCSGTSPFRGAAKLLHIQRVLTDRQNKAFLKQN